MYEITIKEMKLKTVPVGGLSTQIDTGGVTTTIFSETVEIIGINTSEPIENLVIHTKEL